jgi:hypothetical protein
MDITCMKSIDWLTVAIEIGAISVLIYAFITRHKCSDDDLSESREE